MNEDECATMEALERYRAEGSDLSQPMVMDFFVAVPSKEASEAVSECAQLLGFVTSIEQASATRDWTCYCQKTIVPSYDNIRAIEQQLNTIARRFQGRADGFGSFGNAATRS